MKRIKKKYQGVAVPMISPFTEDSKIDLVSVKKIINSFLNAGVNPFLLGTTGEGSSIRDNNKLEFVKTVCRECVGKAIVFVNISGNSINYSIEAAKKYSDLGINVAASTLPNYYQLTSDQMLFYYEQLADSIPIPLMLYNIPATTHMSIPLEVIAELSHHPNIVGLKDSERDLKRLETITENYRDKEDFTYLIGWPTWGNFW